MIENQDLFFTKVGLYELRKTITITIDMIKDNPETFRIFALRSFGESLYHSITDASLENGYKGI